MINLPDSQSEQKAILIRSSYRDVDELTSISGKNQSAITPISRYNLSPRLTLNDESSQRILKCLSILSTLSQDALEEAYQKLKSIQQIDQECYYQESESPEIINSFLSVAKAIPVAKDQYDSIYSDEELDSF